MLLSAVYHLCKPSVAKRRVINFQHCVASGALSLGGATSVVSGASSLGGASSLASGSCGGLACIVTSSGSGSLLSTAVPPVASSCLTVKAARRHIAAAMLYLDKGWPAPDAPALFTGKEIKTICQAASSNRLLVPLFQCPVLPKRARRAKGRLGRLAT
jgi:hypothetical protein